MEEIESRVRRIFSALGETLVVNFADYRPELPAGEKFIFLLQEIRGRPTQEQLHNAAFSAIANIANLKDNLKKWANRNGKNEALVEPHIKSSFHLQVVLDLWNGDKHGYPLKFSHSGREPRMKEIRTTLRLSTGSAPNSSSGLMFGPRGPEVQLTGSGGGGFQIVGVIEDSSGLLLGDLEDFLNKAVDHWLVLFRNYGLDLSRPD